MIIIINLSLLSFLFLLIIIKRNIEYVLLTSKLTHINNNLENKFDEYRKCIYEKCLLKCLIKNKSETKFKPYNDKDVPGPFPFDYSYLENIKNVCNKKTFMLISIITLCSELEERVAIRKVYNTFNSSIQFHFFIGYSSTECEREFKIEKRIYKDISQMPIKESYTNQTIFTLYLHKILPIICPYAKYYGKMDADQYINFPNLINLIKRNKLNKYVIYNCQTWRYFKINTNQRWKYSSPKVIEKYYKNVIPKNGINAFTGSFSVWPSILSKYIYKESLNEPHIIRMEDQHISWLIYRLNKKKINISFYSLQCSDTKKNICSFSYLTDYGIHRIKGKDLYFFYKLIFIKSNNKSQY